MGESGVGGQKSETFEIYISLVSAIQAAKRDQCVSLLRAIESFDTQAFWSACKALNISTDSYLGAAIKLRDIGGVKEAVSLMQSLWLENKKDLQIFIELLVINVLIEPNNEKAFELLERMSPDFKNDRRVKLLVAAMHYNTGDHLPAVLLLFQTNYDDFVYIESFYDLRRKLFISIAELMLGILNEYQSADKNRWRNTENIVAPVLAEAIFHGNSATVFHNIREFLFLDPRFFRFKNTVFIQSCLQQFEQSNADYKVVAFVYLVSIREFGLSKEIMKSAISDEILLQNPLFAKYALLLASFTHDSGLVKNIASAWERICSDPKKWIEGWQDKSFELIAAIEVLARLSALDRVGPGAAALCSAPYFLPSTPKSKLPRSSSPRQRVFIGLFGQVRFASSTLPKIRAFIEADFPPSKYDIYFSISTWDKSGQLQMGGNTGIEHFYTRLPSELVDVMRFHFGAKTVEDIQKHFPTVCEKVLLLSAAKEISETELKSFLGQHVVCDIASDEKFMADVGCRYIGQTGLDGAYLNQVRMFDRLAALGKNARAAMQNYGVAFDCYTVMRADLNILRGSLSALVDSIVCRDQDNIVICDYDPHAIFINGVGDRFLIADEHAASRIFDIRRLIEEMILPRKELLDLYKQRFGAHQFLETALFEHGCEIKCCGAEAVQWEINRGAFSLLDLRNEIASDLRGIQDETIRSSFKDLF
jgi:hypothetical protein